MKKLLKQVHRNIPQMLVFIIDAWFTVALFARATGKTYGVTSLWVYLRAKRLPRSMGFICSPTYRHLQDTVIPEMEKGWRDLGLEEGKHYWKYDYPPKELEIPAPFTPVDNAKYYIFWLNGSATKLVSLDQKALVNSKSFDYGAIVEGRKCKGSVVTEDLIPTLRGNRNKEILDPDTGEVVAKFCDMPEHGSRLIESDLPRKAEERWILQYRKSMDSATVQDIIRLQKIKIDFQKEPDRNKKRIAEIDEAITDARRDLTYVAKASTLDNIHALGVRTVKDFHNTLFGADYDVSILGIEQDEVDNCFYSALSREVHGYSALNEAYVEKLTASQMNQENWRFYKDVIPGQPLYVSVDCNAAHNCFNIFQIKGNQIRKINYIFNESYPGAPADHISLSNDLAMYYKGAPITKIIFVYNNTMIAGEKDGLESKASQIIKQLRSHGFVVEKKYVGQAMTHDSLNEEWRKLLTNQTSYRFSFNLSTCDQWYECCKDAGIIIQDGPKGQQIKKDKRSEKNPKILPRDATHATEGADTFLQYILQNSPANKPRSFMVAG